MALNFGARARCTRVARIHSLSKRDRTIIGGQIQAARHIETLILFLFYFQSIAVRDPSVVLGAFPLLLPKAFQQGYVLKPGMHFIW